MHKVGRKAAPILLYLRNTQNLMFSKSVQLAIYTYDTVQWIETEYHSTEIVKHFTHFRYCLALSRERTAKWEIYKKVTVENYYLLSVIASGSIQEIYDIREAIQGCYCSC